MGSKYQAVVDVEWNGIQALAGVFYYRPEIGGAPWQAEAEELEWELLSTTEHPVPRCEKALSRKERDTIERAIRDHIQDRWSDSLGADRFEARQEQYERGFGR